MFGKNNLNRDFDVIHEIFRNKKGKKTLSKYYAYFKKVYEKVKVLFPI